jgi:hypothetical protein
LGQGNELSAVVEEKKGKRRNSSDSGRSGMILNSREKHVLKERKRTHRVSSGFAKIHDVPSKALVEVERPIDFGMHRQVWALDPKQ